VFINGEDDKLLKGALKLLNSDIRHSIGKNANILLKKRFSVENATQQLLG